MQQPDFCLDWIFEPVTRWDKCLSRWGLCQE